MLFDELLVPELVDKYYIFAIATQKMRLVMIRELNWRLGKQLKNLAN